MFGRSVCNGAGYAQCIDWNRKWLLTERRTRPILIKCQKWRRCAVFRYVGTRHRGEGSSISSIVRVAESTPQRILRALAQYERVAVVAGSQHRAGDTIRRMGENISATAVEAVIDEHPEV